MSRPRRISAASLLITSLMIAAASACGDDSTSTDGSGGDSASTSTSLSGAGTGETATASASTSSGGDGGAGGDDPGEGGAPMGDILGLITASSEVQTVDGVTQITSIVSAYVGIYSSPPFEGLCDVETIGPCARSRCGPLTGDPVTAWQVDAGTLTLDGGTRDVALEVLADGSYDYYLSTTEHLFVGGESLVVTAPGGEYVPAFEIAVTAPSAIDLVAPTFGPEGLTVGGVDLDVEWTGGEAGSVVIYLSTFSNDQGAETSQANLVCTFAAAAGEGVVPAAALAELLPTSDAVNGNFSVVSLSLQIAEVGTGTVELRAFGTARSEGADDGTPFGELYVE